jgi:hypothetical protein
MTSGTPIITAIIQYSSNCTRRACRFSSSVGSMTRNNAHPGRFSNR